jgi:hypothetical protein
MAVSDYCAFIPWWSNIFCNLPLEYFPYCCGCPAVKRKHSSKDISYFSITGNTLTGKTVVSQALQGLVSS